MYHDIIFLPPLGIFNLKLRLQINFIVARCLLPVPIIQTLAILLFPFPKLLSYLFNPPPTLLPMLLFLLILPSASSDLKTLTVFFLTSSL